MAQKIGWIGLGRMGEAMVKRLTKGGYGVDVWNRTRSKADRFSSNDCCCCKVLSYILYARHSVLKPGSLDS